MVSAKALTTRMSLCGYLIDGVMIGFINAALMHSLFGVRLRVRPWSPASPLYLARLITGISCSYLNL